MPSGDFISVYARVRPSDHPSPSLSALPSSLDISVPRAQQEPDNYSFRFSNVFGPEASQQQVFDCVAKDFVFHALDGINCSIFAYGQTGSGKTFTMCGGKGHYMRDRGIIPRTLGGIFAAIDAKDDDVHYSVSMSMIEIYKEIGRDLLARDQKAKTKAGVTVSLIKGDQPVLIGAKRVALASEEEGLQQYCLGEVQRTVAATAHNLQSSRSHCVCTLFIEASDPGEQVVRASKIQIIDLAGSERLKPYEKGSQEQGSLMKEAVSINLSLHHLSVVIAALNNKSSLIPYRNSFLTRLLKDALGGNARAAMVMTVDPSDAAMPETISSCRFAQRVANVKTNAKVNEERDPRLVIAELKRKNAELEAALVGNSAPEHENVPPEKLHRRIRAFLEDDRGGSEGGSTLKVGAMPHGAFAAFRVFREIFWEHFRDRAAASPLTDGAESSEQAEESYERPLRCPADMDSGTPSTMTVTCTSRGARVQDSDRQDPPDADSVNRTALLDCQAECRMLRAALAAQPAPRPTKKKATRLSREAKLQADLTAAHGECKRLRSALAAFAKSGQSVPSTKPRPKLKPKARPKRPASADISRDRDSGRTRTLHSGTAFGGGTVGFCDADIVVDPFKRGSSMGSSMTTTMRAGMSGCSLASALTRPPIPSGGASTPSTTYSSAAPSPAPVRISEMRRASSPATGRMLSTPISAAPKPSEAWTRECDRTSASIGSADVPSQQSTLTLPMTVTALVEPAATIPPVGPSQAWLQATSALTEEDLAQCGSEAKAYEVFLQHDPRAGDIWQAELQRFIAERRRVEAEAKSLGEEVNQTKAAMSKVQNSLEALKAKLREVEAQAAVDATARTKSETLRNLISAEEPRLELLLNEKRQIFENGCDRLKDLKREHIHIQHAQKQLQATVQAEFQLWQKAVEARYPLELAAAIASIAAAIESAEDEANEA